jgi:hypothetical protein
LSRSNPLWIYTVKDLHNDLKKALRTERGICGCTVPVFFH